MEFEIIQENLLTEEGRPVTMYGLDCGGRVFHSLSARRGQVQQFVQRMQLYGDIAPQHVKDIVQDFLCQIYSEAL